MYTAAMYVNCESIGFWFYDFYHCFYVVVMLQLIWCNCERVFNRQLIFRAVVSRLRRQHPNEDDGELKDPLPDKLRSSVVRNVNL